MSEQIIIRAEKNNLLFPYRVIFYGSWMNDKLIRERCEKILGKGGKLPDTNNRWVCSHEHGDLAIQVRNEGDAILLKVGTSGINMGWTP